MALNNLSIPKLFEFIKTACMDLLPYGTIVMYYGTTIPNNWHICDGSNGTPDLRDRFIVAAGKSYSLKATGGEATHTLTTNEMPSHRHRNAHFDEIGFDVTNGGGGVPVKQRMAMGDNTPYNNYVWDTYSTYVGGGAAHENRPPYYALYFIMKIS